MREISQLNYYYKTQATWKECIIPDRHPDYISESGSQYWYSSDGVTRFSDHWGSVSTCKWTCSEECGFCNYSDFIDLLPTGIYRFANDYGNIDVRQPIPRGYCHIRQIDGINLWHWLEKLKIPYVPALVGFSGSRSNWRPKFDGYVIPSRCRPKVLDLVERRLKEKQNSDQV